MLEIAATRPCFDKYCLFFNEYYTLGAIRRPIWKPSRLSDRPPNTATVAAIATSTISSVGEIRAIAPQI